MHKWTVNLGYSVSLLIIVKCSEHIKHIVMMCCTNFQFCYLYLCIVFFVQTVHGAQTSYLPSTRQAALGWRTCKRWQSSWNCWSTLWTWMQTITTRQSAALGCWPSLTQQPFTFSWKLTINEPKYFRRLTCNTGAERPTHLTPSGTPGFWNEFKSWLHPYKHAVY